MKNKVEHIVNKDWVRGVGDSSVIIPISPILHYS